LALPQASGQQRLGSDSRSLQMRGCRAAFRAADHQL